MRATPCLEARAAGKDGCSRRPAAPCFSTKISALPPALQVRLLRFLQEHAFERMGGEETLHVDVRVIAASNHDLREEKWPWVVSVRISSIG
jgi:transcriptional regulator of acetoin/glycerol metabolism